MYYIRRCVRTRFVCVLVCVMPMSCADVFNTYTFCAPSNERSRSHGYSMCMYLFQPYASSCARCRGDSERSVQRTRMNTYARRDTLTAPLAGPEKQKLLGVFEHLRRRDCVRCVTFVSCLRVCVCISRPCGMFRIPAS